MSIVSLCEIMALTCLVTIVILIFTNTRLGSLTESLEKLIYDKENEDEEL